MTVTLLERQLQGPVVHLRPQTIELEDRHFHRLKRERENGIPGSKLKETGGMALRVGAKGRVMGRQNQKHWEAGVWPCSEQHLRALSTL